MRRRPRDRCDNNDISESKQSNYRDVFKLTNMCTETGSPN